MEQVTERYLQGLYESLSSNKIDLYDLPPVIALFYYLGEAHEGERLSKQIDRLRTDYAQALADRDRYYSHASRGGFTVPLLKQGKTFAELSRLRGENALADKAELRAESFQFDVRRSA